MAPDTKVLEGRTDGRTADGQRQNNIPPPMAGENNKDIMMTSWNNNKDITRNGAAEADAGAPGLVMGPCIAEINRIVIREVQYQLEVNRCRNEEIIVKGNSGWAWPMWAGPPRVGNWAMHKVQYQFEVNRCRNKEIIRGLCGRGAPGLVMGSCIVEIDPIVIREVRYQFEDNRCRNEEIIFQGSSANRRTDGQTDGGDNHNIPKLFKKRGDKDNFGWVWPIMGWAPQVEIDHIVIRDVQYQFEVNRCRNEEIIVKGNFGWAWPMWALPMSAGCPRIDRIVIREVQHQFEVNRAILGGRSLCGRGAPGLVIGPCIVEIDRIVIREAQNQFEVNRCRNEEVYSPIINEDKRGHITKNAPPTGGHVFQATGTIFELVQNIIGTNLLTKFHDDRKMPRPLGGHVFAPTGTIFKLIQDIIGTNHLTKFHDDQTINVASRVLTRLKNAPPPGGHVF
ncbi:hypothetical protein DPMN_088585 [Dreissena polymorpha]|uniref:Uncharacterized protein n=1 Tax=Dreissena polymorpha TaxID=45954 RepID=A0A9D4QWI8_DREPO|nr:hypothetical protein DPMN_088585 [Dreissena polymorpha]